MSIWRLALALLAISAVSAQPDKQDRNSKLLHLRRLATTSSFVIELDARTYK